MGAAWLLSIDVGTTSCKLMALDLDGKALAAAREDYPIRRPGPNQVEQNPEHWWQAVQRALHSICSNPAVDPKAIKGIGLSGMAATHVFLDKDHRILRSAILWQDTRATREAAEIEAAIADRRHEILGGQMYITASMQAARMLWMARYEPEIIAKSAVVLGSKDYINFCLTGDLTSDPTSCGGFADGKSGRVHPTMKAAVGFGDELLPEVFLPHAVTGTVRAAVAAEFGLPPDVPVAAGMIDSWCNMLGMGLISPGQGFDTAGTAEVVGLTTESGSGTAGLAFVTGVNVIYGVTQGGCDSLQWFVDEFGTSEKAVAANLSRSEFQLLDEAAAGIAAGAEKLLFLPYLQGERAPFFDAKVRGAYFGINRSHGRAHFARAVLEGVAFSVRHLLEDSEQMAGHAADSIITASGGSKSPLWNQIKADICGRAVKSLMVADGGSVGAAILAAVGTGLYTNYDEACRRMIHIREEYQPNPAHRSRYDDLYGIYTQLYPCLKQQYHTLYDLA